MTRASEQAVRLDGGTEIVARTTVRTAGVRTDPLTTQIPTERDELGRPVGSWWTRIYGANGVHDRPGARATAGARGFHQGAQAGDQRDVDPSADR
ncbi:hypothetical protein ADL21_04755 [Streptomyces albus subsp. albus]|nr:hypothetical protein ADL21_04755 [Streptomyces albus subsp. albus]